MWPWSRVSVRLEGGGVVVRPFEFSDEKAWLQLRGKNHAWLKPWEANSPPGMPAARPVTFSTIVRNERKAWHRRTAFSAVIEVEGQLVGRVSLTGVQWGAFCSGYMGYWIAEEWAGHGIVPNAVALLERYAFSRGLHRVQIAIRPENEASLAVVRKLGYREEGYAPEYLYINGKWADHKIFARLSSDPQVELDPFRGRLDQ